MGGAFNDDNRKQSARCMVVAALVTFGLIIGRTVVLSMSPEVEFLWDSEDEIFERAVKVAVIIGTLITFLGFSYLFVSVAKAV